MLSLLLSFYTVQTPGPRNVPSLFKVDLSGSTNLFKTTSLKAWFKYLEKKSPFLLSFLACTVRLFDPNLGSLHELTELL